MPTSTKKVHAISLPLLLFLAILAIVLDFSIGLIPILGAFVGFIFSLVVSIQLYLFEFEKGAFLRTVAVIIGSFFVETLSFALAPTNLIFVVLVYATNLWKVRRQSRKIAQYNELSDDVVYLNVEGDNIKHQGNKNNIRRAA
ncbi:hypothetical protein CL644_01225 [bacterium]|nr:hypothetical protein [Parcubacteria group bacterium]MBF05309.1 hypothetical protein [bacterium]|tara:strand:- start:13888 stop:14313 length:426 start_codon:yes stop_codon:yes gene_type:complete